MVMDQISLLQDLSLRATSRESTKTTGTTITGTLAAGAFRFAYNLGFGNSYNYYEGISFDPATYDLDNVVFVLEEE